MQGVLAFPTQNRRTATSPTLLSGIHASIHHSLMHANSNYSRSSNPHWPLIMREGCALKIQNLASAKGCVAKPTNLQGESEDP